MGFGTSIFLIAVGAVLRFAVHVSTHGVNLHTIGVILMVVGVAGLVLSLLWLTVLADRRRRSVAYEERAVAPAHRPPYDPAP